MRRVLSRVGTAVLRGTGIVALVQVVRGRLVPRLLLLLLGVVRVVLALAVGRGPLALLVVVVVLLLSLVVRGHPCSGAVVLMGMLVVPSVSLRRGGLVGPLVVARGRLVLVRRRMSLVALWLLTLVVVVTSRLLLVLLLVMVAVLLLTPISTPSVLVVLSRGSLLLMMAVLTMPLLLGLLLVVGRRSSTVARVRRLRHARWRRRWWREARGGPCVGWRRPCRFFSMPAAVVGDVLRRTIRRLAVVRVLLPISARTRAMAAGLLLRLLLRLLLLWCEAVSTRRAAVLLTFRSATGSCPVKRRRRRPRTLNATLLILALVVLLGRRQWTELPLPRRLLLVSAAVVMGWRAGVLVLLPHRHGVGLIGQG